ncbi:hypothetical protein JTB14_016545 [Gonioctena quinquepunctata]|nr:hypothetical protein JTB14_016545 [Gonioctena quinquepunctata]
MTVKKELRSLWNHYLEMKRFKDTLNDISEGSILSSYFISTVHLSSVLVYFLNVGSINNVSFVINAVFTVVMMVIMIELGQQIQNEVSIVLFINYCRYLI